MDRPSDSDGFQGPDCSRVHQIWEQALLDEVEIGDRDRDFVRGHTEACAECAELVGLLEAFDAPEPLPAGAIDAVLRDHQDRRDRRRRPFYLATGLVAAAAAVALIVYAAWPEPAPDPDLSQPEIALVAEDGTLWVEGGTLSTADDPLRLHRGEELTVALDRATRAQVEALSDDRLALDLRTGRLAVQVDPQASLAVAVETRFGRVLVKGTVFAVEISENEVRVEVVRGSVSVESPELSYGSAEVSANQSLAIRARRVSDLETARRDAILALLGIELTPAAGDGPPQSIAIRIEERAPEETAGAEPLDRPEQPGATGSSAAAIPAAPAEAPGDVQAEPAEQAIPEEAVPEEAPEEAPGPGDLIRIARERRLSGDWTGAAEAYREVLTGHPNRPEAVTVLLPLAEIELGHLGRPNMALQHFTRYSELRPNGSLAEEAFYGRCTALGAMGQTQREHRALEEFLERFPGSVHAKNARARLEKLSQNKTD